MANIKWWRVKCLGCGQWFPASRKDATACGANCRQRLCRARNGKRRDMVAVKPHILAAEPSHFIRKCGCAGCRAMDPFGAGSWVPALSQKVAPPSPAPLKPKEKGRG